MMAKIKESSVPIEFCLGFPQFFLIHLFNRRKKNILRLIDAWRSGSKRKTTSMDTKRGQKRRRKVSESSSMYAGVVSVNPSRKET
jgi:hypothetical protein